MNYKLQLDFKFEHTDDKMRLRIGDQIISPVGNHGSYSAKIDLPTTIFVYIEGKNEDKDTLFKDDIILKDRHIRLIGVKIDGIMPNSDFIRRWPKLHVGGLDRNQKIYSHYWGFNGVVELIFEGNDPMTWLLRTNKFRDDSWQKNQE